MNKKKTFKNFAPGRVCLVGEHCDYANGKAIAMPLQNKVNFKAKVLKNSRIYFKSKIGNKIYAANIDIRGNSYRTLYKNPLGYSIAAVKALLLKNYRSKMGGAKIEITTDLPIQKGLSSSAAVTVGTIKIVNDLFNLKLSSDKIAEFAYIAEHDIVGIGCGRMDQLVSAYNSPILMHFKQNSKPKIEKINPSSAQTYILIATPIKSKRNIKAMLHDSNKAYFTPKEKSHFGFKKALDELIPKQVIIPMKKWIAKGDTVMIGKLIRLNQQIYNEYFLPVSEYFNLGSLQDCFKIVKESGSLGEKWTGAGGEGSFISVFDSKTKREFAKKSLLKKSPSRLEFIECIL